MININEKVNKIKQSAIREMSHHCVRGVDINLGQGLCDIAVQQIIKDSANFAINNNNNLYSSNYGLTSLREAIKNKLTTFNKIPLTDSDVIVTNGATGAFNCAVLSLFNPGDEVILFEPFYGYHKNILEFNQITVKAVPFDLNNNFAIDWTLLGQVINKNTRGIIICNPCNPCGKVFSKDELLQLGKLAKENNMWVITDEIYEYITYDDSQHVSFAALEDFANFTITITGFSKTYNVTGWRLGYMCAPKYLIDNLANIQDLLYICSPTPLQHAMVSAMNLKDDYYTQMQQHYQQGRDLVVSTLLKLGFKVPVPQGAYYIFADFSEICPDSATEFAFDILKNSHVATIPGGDFYLNPAHGKSKLRICYALDIQVLQVAMNNLTLFIKQFKDNCLQIM